MIVNCTTWKANICKLDLKQALFYFSFTLCIIVVTHSLSEQLNIYSCTWNVWTEKKCEVGKILWCKSGGHTKWFLP